MPNATLRFAAAYSPSIDVQSACNQIKAALNGPIDLAFAFVSAAHRDDMAALAVQLREQLGAAALLGCTAESLVCNDQEYEQPGGVALWAAHMPGGSIAPMRLTFTPTPEGGAFVGWPEDLPASWPAGAALLLLADPFSFPADVLLSQLNESQPGVPVIGGMASGGWQPGENRLLFGGDAVDSGAVAVLVHGPVAVTSVVSQGCRPIGQPFVVTKADRNMIGELGGRPALAQLQELFDKLSTDDQRLARQGLHVGQVIDEYRETFGRGDFLVRNVQGADSQSGAIAIGDWVRVGRTVQFHVRDATTADEDLDALLSAARQNAAANCLGALLFTCNGRGTRLFEQPHHDAAALARKWPKVPTAGFFAQGEIGPIGGKNFVHGFTASAALFGPAEG
ncbi:MAG: FIST N-terminal domain-containing protein [Pirellulales bacterium]